MSLWLILLVAAVVAALIGFGSVGLIGLVVGRRSSSTL